MICQTVTILERIGDRVAQQGTAVAQVFPEWAPAEEILCVTERHRADLIVMGSKGLTGLDRYLLVGVLRKVRGMCLVRC